MYKTQTSLQHTNTVCYGLQGIGPRIIWIGVGGAIFFGVLEKTKQILAQRCPGPPGKSISFKQD